MSPEPDGDVASDEASTVAQSAAEALAVWLSDRYGGTVQPAAPATSSGEGFDSDIYFVQFSADVLPDEWRAPLVMRVKPGVDQLSVARSEAAIQEWLADRGYPTPRVLAVFEPGELLDRPTQVMDRVPGEMVLQAVMAKPWTARRHVRDLAALHARLHAMDSQGFPGDDDLLDRRLGLTRRTAIALDDQALADGLRRIDALADQLRDAPTVVCHGDYHPLNVMVSDEGMSVIDWSDAGVGDRHGDVARTLLLFDLASIAASNKLERLALGVVGPLLGRFYRRSYTRLAPLDDSRVALWKPVHLLHGWSQARGLHAGLFDEGDQEGSRTDRLPPALIDDLRRRFDDALADVT